VPPAPDASDTPNLASTAKSQTDTRQTLGLEVGEAVGAEQLVALMEGRHPVSGEFIRRAGADGRGAPDPQLHSHVVVTGVVRQDGQFAAVASRPLFRAARELGAFYRGALAQELQQQGYEVVAGTGRDGRYFEVAGISENVREALSGRSREVWLAAERFRARYGRAPERDELRNVKLENRKAKTPQSRPELQATWDERAAGQHVDRAHVETLRSEESGGVQRVERAGWQERVERSLTAQGATFSERDLRASVLEQGVGELSPERVSEHARELVASGEVIELE